MGATASPSWWMRDARLPDPERNVRVHVHVALAGVLLAVLAPAVSWALVLWDVRAPAGRWKRRLVALAIVDTLLFGGVAAARAAGVDLAHATTTPPRIGIALDPGDTAPGAHVVAVAPASPAARAGIREGDRIVAVDDRVVRDPEELAGALAAAKSGETRRLTVRRNGRELVLDVVPELGAPEPRAASQSLFTAPRHAPPPARAPPNHHRVLVGAGAIDVLLVLGLAIAARRRGVRMGPGAAVIAGLVALSAVSGFVLGAFEDTFGLSLGALLVAMLAGSLALLVVGVVATRRLFLPTARFGARLHVPRAVTLGVFYGVAGAARIGVFVSLAAALLHLPLVNAAGAFGLSFAWGPLGVALFLLATVVVAPIAEELLFRGILLPWLTTWMRPGSALAWSALVFAIGHLYYGVGALLIGFYGVVLGWARLRTGRLAPSMLLHALLNGSTAIIMLAMSGR